MWQLVCRSFDIPNDILINGNKIHGREHFNANIDLTVVHGAPPFLFWIGLWNFGNANQWDLKWSFRASWS